MEPEVGCCGLENRRIILYSAKDYVTSDTEETTYPSVLVAVIYMERYSLACFIFVYLLTNITGESLTIHHRVEGKLR
jgi:hypothetical protein